MDKQINNWLQKLDIVNKIAETIHSEKLDDEEKNLAMQRNGYEILPAKYITEKCWRRRYQYLLLLKSESESDKQRLANNDWLDELSNALAKANKEHDYPDLKSIDAECYHVESSNGLLYEDTEDGAASIYAIQLYFEIKGGEEA